MRLQIGERRLPTGEIETLVGRLLFILDFLEDENEWVRVSPEISSAITELESLIKDVKKYETNASKRLGPKKTKVASSRKSKNRRD
jgi:hypothetical protein